MSFQCQMCDAVLHDKFSKEALGWDWFHGYLPETVHFCPTHRHSQEHNYLLEQSQRKPDGNRVVDQREK